MLGNDGDLRKGVSSCARSHPQETLPRSATAEQAAAAAGEEEE